MSVGPVGVGFAVLAAVALAAQSLAVRLSTRTRSVTDVVAVVFVFNVLVLAPATAFAYFPEFGLTPVSALGFAVAGLLGSLLARFLLFVGIDRLGASRAEPLKSTFPIVALVSAVVVFGEALTVPLLAGILLLVGGAVGVSWDARASPVSASGRAAWADVGYPLAAALLLGVDPVFTKVALAEGTPALVGVTVRVLAAASGFGLFLLWRRARTGTRRSLRPTRWTLLAGLSNTIYLAAYLAALARAPVSVVTSVLGASPLLVLLGAAALEPRDERVTPRLALAVAVLVVGVLLVLRG